MIHLTHFFLVAKEAINASDAMEVTGFTSQQTPNESYQKKITDNVDGHVLAGRRRLANLPSLQSATFSVSQLQESVKVLK